MSDLVLERKIRSRKLRSVSESLAHSATPQSDQAEVWEGIQELQSKADFWSASSAMNDVFKAQAEKLSHCLQTFRRIEGQVGLLIVVGRSVVGFDIVSRHEVYARLHEKLVRSYVLDALLEDVCPVISSTEALQNAGAFIQLVGASQEEAFASVGYGQDHRFHAPGCNGSALVYCDKLIHAAFLTPEARDEGLRRRRS